MNKNCPICKMDFSKPKGCSKKIWAIRKYCTQKCMAIGQIGVPRSEETKRKIGAFSKGNKYAVGKGKIRAQTVLNCQNCDIEFSIENHRLKSAKYCSKKCMYSALNKGRCTENELIRKSTKYKQWRLAVFERDNHTCTQCGDRNYEGRGVSVKINADHIKPFSLYPDLRFDIGNGRTLCENCHRKTPTYGTSLMWAIRKQKAKAA